MSDGGVCRNYSDRNIIQGHWTISPLRPLMKLNNILELFKDEKNLIFVYVGDNAFGLS